ncbi:MAG: putative transcriptional regulator YheO, contains PAS and DNA-binding HTH domains [Oscillospiraceae bacterium]
MKTTSSKILRPYISLVEFLGKVLGPDYEIALHEINANSQSIIAIANGHISGRKVGAPITNLALKIIKEQAYKSHDYLLNYKGVSKSGKILRSSTIFIKDENDELVGMLCINFDASRYRDISRQILQLCNLPAESVEEEVPPELPNALPDMVENFPDNIGEMIENVIETCLPDNKIHPKRLTQAEKIKIVDLLNKRGVFLLKGAVSQVAKRLHCSEPTIYRYLSALNNNK